MRLPTNRKQRQAFHSGGGSTHVRYDHLQRPTKIEVACPRCGGCAAATEPTYDHGILVVDDTSSCWNKSDFKIRCTSCFWHASNLHYSQLPEPYHQVSVFGRTLWAWNAEHLEMIEQSLEGQSVRGHPYAFFETYIHRGWQQWRNKFVRAIKEHMKTHNNSLNTAPLRVARTGRLRRPAG